MPGFHTSLGVSGQGTSKTLLAHHYNYDDEDEVGNLWAMCKRAKRKLTHMPGEGLLRMQAHDTSLTVPAGQREQENPTLTGACT